MKPPTPKDVINRRFEQVWNARDKNAIVAMMTEDAVAHLAGGDDRQACLHWEASGTHKGDFAGIATTNRKIAFRGMSFVTVRDGKIAEGWDCWDFGTLTTALSSSSG
jgi:hypothetical protein